MSEALHLYYEALNRLQEGTPVLLPTGTKISNDAVSLEAGRKKGSIKKSRLEFSELINAIKKAQERQRTPIARKSAREARPKVLQPDLTSAVGADSDRYRVMYEGLLAERAAVLLEAFRQRLEIKSLLITAAGQAAELTDLRAVRSALEAELTRLRAGKLQSVPVIVKVEGQ